MSYLRVLRNGSFLLEAQVYSPRRLMLSSRWILTRLSWGSMCLASADYGV